ncbi:MAG: DUF99 family protein [archaeon]
MKSLIRVIGIDDGYFSSKKGTTLLVGVIYRLDNRVEGILSQKIKVDGKDSTKKIIKMVKDSKFTSQIKCVFLHGVNFAGFNVADVKELNKKLRVPIITCFRRNPDMKGIRRALSNLSDSGKRFNLILNAGKIYKAERIHFQCTGIEATEAKAMIKKCRVHSLLPEPLRLSHLIASGVTKK